MRGRSSTEREKSHRSLIVLIGSVIAVAVAAGVYFFARQVPAPAPEADVAPVLSNSEAATAKAPSDAAPAPKAAVASAAHAPRFSSQDALAGVAPPSATDAEEAKDEDYAAQVGDTRPAAAAPAAIAPAATTGDTAPDVGNSTD